MARKQNGPGGLGALRKRGVQLPDSRYTPSGIPELDLLLGGGLQNGRWIEFFGDDKAGKTTLVTLLAVNAQKLFPDKTVLYIDSERKFSFDNFLALGGDLDESRFILLNDSVLERVTEVFQTAYEDESQISLIIWDSFGATASAAAANSRDFSDSGEFKSRLAQESATQAEMLRRIADFGTYTSPPVILTNQVRTNIGGYHVSMKPYGGTAYRHKITHSIKVFSAKDAFVTDPETGEVQAIAVALSIHRSNSRAEGLSIGRESSGDKSYYRPVSQSPIKIWVGPDSEKYRLKAELEAEMYKRRMVVNSVSWWSVFRPGSDPNTDKPILKIQGEAAFQSKLTDPQIQEALWKIIREYDESLAPGG